MVTDNLTPIISSGGVGTVTFWVAIWGAFFSTILGVIRIIEFCQSHAIIRVNATIAYPIYGGYPSTDAHLSLTAINKGRRMIKLEGAGLTLSDKRTIPFITDIFQNRFPKDLDENDSYSIYFRISEIQNTLKGEAELKIIKGWFRNKIGGYHYCKISQKYFKK